MKSTNFYDSREAWLRAATDELRSDFENIGFPLPDKMRFAIAFTSTGKRGRMAGECWHPESSDDQHYEVILRADLADPVDVLGTLVHELCHSTLPPEIKHGKEFRGIARRIGLEGAMRHTQPTPLLEQRLKAIAANLGPLPHAKLNFIGSSDTPKKQGPKWFKAECNAPGCGYSVRITAKWAKTGLPNCPVGIKHGKLVCDLPEDNDDKADK